MNKLKINRFNAENRDDPPRITQEQLEAWLYGGIGGTVAKKIEELLNGVSYDITDFRAGIVPAVQPKPEKLNVHDVPLGTIMYYCGNPKQNGSYHGVEIIVVETPMGFRDTFTYGRVLGNTWDGAFTLNELTTDITKSVGYEPPAPAYVAPKEDRTHWAAGDVVRCLSRTLSGDRNGYTFFGEVGTEYTILEPYADNGVSDVLFEGGGSGARERFTLVRKAPPKRLPIERPVRMADVEAGDILRYCGVDDDHDSWPELGSEVVVVGISQYGQLMYSCVNKRGETTNKQYAPDYCVAQGFSFVRRPFKVGEVVQSTTNTVWVGNMLVVNPDTGSDFQPVRCVHPKYGQGNFPINELKRVL